MELLDKRNTLNFNKEIFFGEVGALIGTPSVSYLVSLFTSVPKDISYAAVIGGLIGQAIFWLSMRAYDKRVDKKLSAKSLGEDIIYFTPVAFLIAISVYYPTLFFTSEYLLNDQYKVVYAVISSQILAFSFFLVLINIYRYFLAKVYGKVL